MIGAPQEAAACTADLETRLHRHERQPVPARDRGTYCDVTTAKLHDFKIVSILPSLQSKGIRKITTVTRRKGTKIHFCYYDCLTDVC